MNKLIVSHDGYIELQANGGITWYGVWANEIRSIFWDACRKQGIESNQEALNEFITRVLKV